MVRSVNWWYIKRTLPENLKDITTLLIPYGAYLEVLFLGLSIACCAATALSCQIHKRPDHPYYCPLHWHSNHHPDTVEEEGELLLLAPDYLTVGPLCVIFSMIVDCCLALF